MSTKVCIVGCGYVGESLINAFSTHYNVVGYDISTKRINELNPLYTENKKVTLTNDVNDIADANAYLVAVPTNIDEEQNIVLSPLMSVRKMLEGVVSRGDIIVVESSVYVGATREIFGQFLDRGVLVGMSSERVSPGTHDNCQVIPKLVSGLDKNSLFGIAELYGRVIDKTVPVSSSETAEMCKLYENCFRSINIAYINEIADLCRKKNVDINEVVSAASTKPFGYMPFYPGFGIGGFCISQNPIYLFKNAETNDLPLLRKSFALMRDRPKKRACEIEENDILVLGVGFKENQTLTAFSPSLELVKHLKENGKNVDVVDPNVYDQEFEFNLELLKKYKLVIIGCKQNFIDYEVIQSYEKLGGRVINY